MGNDYLYGGPGNDKLDGQSGNDHIYGGAGDDNIAAGVGDDWVYGGAGNDTIHLGKNPVPAGLSDDDHCWGGPGNDRISASSGNAVMYGEDGIDILRGGGGSDWIYGGDGNDTIYGYGGNDNLFGDDGADELVGGDGRDRIFGDDGNDTIDGGADGDWLKGGAGADTVTGGPGADAFERHALDTYTDFNRGQGDYWLWTRAAAAGLDLDFCGWFEGHFSDQDDDNLLHDSGNNPEFVEIVAVNGSADNVGVEITTAHGGTLTLNSDGTFFYQAPPDFVGDDYFSYMIDNGAGTATGTVTLHIKAVVANDAEYSTLTNQSLLLPVPGLLDNAFAASGNDLSVSAVNGDPANVGFTTYTTQGGQVTVYADGSTAYTPPTDFEGDYSFTATYSDGIDSATATVTLHVVNVLASDAEFTTPHQDELDVAAESGLLTYAQDAASDTLTVTAITGATANVGTPINTDNNGTLTVYADGSIDYTPPTNFAGDDWFSWTVSDSDGHTSTAWAVIHVTNNAPTASDAYYWAPGDLSISAASGLLSYASDADDDPLTVVAINDTPLVDGSITLYSSHGATLTVYADGSFDYTTGTDPLYVDVFSFTISDGITTCTAYLHL